MEDHGITNQEPGHETLPARAVLGPGQTGRPVTTGPAFAGALTEARGEEDLSFVQADGTMSR